MGNKTTCGECRFYKPYNDAICPYTHRMVMPPMTRACSRFEPPTKGDRIRQECNRELAEYFVYESGAMWASTLIVDKTFDTYDEAIEATEEYLNAPAESEGEDE